MEYFFDSYAIIEILNKNVNYATHKDKRIITSDLNLGEVYYYLLTRFGKEKADFWYENLNVDILIIDSNIIINAMLFKSANRNKNLSMVDCIGYKLAMKNNLKFLTGDDAFRSVIGVEFLK